MKKGFQITNDVIQTEKIIDFLEEGFDWGKNRSKLFKEKFNNQISETPRAAYEIENNRIVSAILLFDQGWCDIESKNVINLSSWYALPEFRGPRAINFARRLLSALDAYIITNYTPSVAAYVVFKFLNFSDMKVTQHNVGIQKEKPFFSLKSVWELLSFSKGHKIHHLRSITPMDSKENIVVCYAHLKAKLGLIPMNIIDIYVLNEDSKVPAFGLIQLIFRYRAIRVNIFRKSSQISPRRVWLVKNSIEEGLFISPISSELQIPP